MGLILAGAGMGLGAGMQQVGKNWSAENLEKMREDAATARQSALIEANKFLESSRQGHAEKLQDKAQTFQSGERKSGQEFQRGLITDVQQPFQREQQDRGFTQAKTMQDAQQAFQTEQNKLQRDLTREQIASHEKVAAANNATALQVAQLGGTVQQDKDGNMLFFDKSGKSTQIMDPNNPGKPLKGYKDLTPAAKAYADVIKAQLVGLNAQETAGTGDAEAITQKRVLLNAQLLNVLTGGIDSTGKKTTLPTPTATDKADAAKRAKDSKFMDAYAARFGAAAAAEITNAQRPSGGIIKPTREPEYQPIPGSAAAEAVARRKSEIARKEKEKADTKAASAATQAAFDEDAQAMSNKELLSKWDSRMGELSQTQQAKLFRIRNPM